MVDNSGSSGRPHGPADRAWLRAMDAYTAGAYARAEEEFRTAVRLDPGMADAWLGLHALRCDTSGALLSMHRHKKRFGEQRRRHARPLSSWYWLGWWVQPVLEDERDLALAHASHWLDGRHLTELDRAMAQCPPAEQDPSVRFLRACRSYLLKDWEQLIRDTDQLLDDPLLGIEAGLFGGMARVRLDMCAQAQTPLAASLARCRSEQPQRKELRYWLARAYEGAGRSAAALPLYRAVHRADPAFMDTAARLAAIAAEDGLGLLEELPVFGAGDGLGAEGPGADSAALDLLGGVGGVLETAVFGEAGFEQGGFEGTGFEEASFEEAAFEEETGFAEPAGAAEEAGYPEQPDGGPLQVVGRSPLAERSGEGGPGGPEAPAEAAPEEAGEAAEAVEAAAGPGPGSTSQPQPAPGARAATAPRAGLPGTGPEAGGQQRLDEALAALEQMVGLEPVKRQVRALSAQLRMAGLRAEQGLPVQPPKRHFVFSGPSGTGKTTVARILGQVFHALGLLSGDHLVEAQRADLVGEFLGQTAVKANDLIDSALDGVLFIDEAYSLANSGYSKGDAYGDEALQVLLKRAEDNRDRLVVILAGYPEGMNRLLAANPGLNSRFTTRVDFPSYRPAELTAIGSALAARDGDGWDEDAADELASICAHVVGEGWIDELGNGRFIRTLYEKSCAYRDLRLSLSRELPTREDLATLRLPDLVQAYGELIDGRS
ncbi:AAA family ATPase [Kitasatospora sp. NBC_01287]|uniref:AAA family ATPase n=1 Tax=Kitasatospora sp. NBC_01287 TaxID=2903573 RepID=UPI00224F65CF|nr:AAA family ATPase [Kitasatospora sp. NBC_01287]MCX4744890.1 AAA family ATPase [Kitasatospora sp. NBC_01287]